MHHIYTTPAFIIHSTQHGEAGKFLMMFTKDFGMIGATAQGIRLIQSKLRYHTQDSSYSNISIVRGKEVWRLTGAQELAYQKNNILYLKILRLLKRLLQGEERNEKLFNIVEQLYLTAIEEKDHTIAELLTVLRILNTLGYVGYIDELGEFLANDHINTDLLLKFSKFKPKVVKIINESLKQSQL
jgi:recombinational DNA repair protein (RecF pathway)